MKRKERIKNLLNNQLNEFTMKIIDNSYKHIGHFNFNGKDETHIEIHLKKKFDHKMDRLKVHKKINETLKLEFENGLHSLEIKIK